MNDEEKLVPISLIEDISWHFQCYCKSKDLRARADHLTKLSNDISDLQTYHPGYDYNSGTMPWEREDYEG